MNRRRFLRYAVAVPLAAVVSCRRSGRHTTKAQQSAPKPTTRGRACHLAPRQSGPGEVLQPLEWATLAAVCERLLPRDEDPGASDAAVVGYIDGQLRHAPMAKYYPMLRQGLRFLHGAARQRHKKLFAALPAEAQDTLLGDLQGGRLGRQYGAGAFKLMLGLTLEGFFCDPIYGGNKDAVGWKMIGFESQAPGPRCPYEGRS